MMMLPLHKNAHDAKKGADFHAGLWYDRFFNVFLPEAKKPDKHHKEEKDLWAKNKTDWIKNNAGKVGNANALNKAVSKQQAIAKACGGQSLVMSSEWHFVTGMGNNHPVENGFAWHHTLGVPYLTGAAVKGMVRAWCEVWEVFDNDKIKHWFGGKGDEQAGEIIFFDAIPTQPVQLKADIMTPHYGDWYAKGGEIKDVVREPEKVPADWHDPVPVPFLVVDKGASFQFALGKRAGSTIDMSEISKALSDALQWLGAGAKTAAGYGRFSEDARAKMQREKEEKERKEREIEAKVYREQEAKRATMTPLAAELDKWVSTKPEPNTVAQWLDGIDERPAEDRQQIAAVLKAYYEQRGTWKKPSKKQKENVQKIKGLLQS